MSLSVQLKHLFDGSKKSYMMVLILSILKSVDASGKALYREVENNYVKFYQDRYDRGVVVEKQDPEQYQKPKDQIRWGEFRNSLRTARDSKTIQEILEHRDGWIGFRKEVWDEMRMNEIHELERFAQEKLAEYYGEKFDEVQNITYSIDDWLISFRSAVSKLDLKYSDNLLINFWKALIERNFVLMNVSRDETIPLLAEVFVRWISPKSKLADPFYSGARIESDRITYLVEESDALSIEFTNNEVVEKATHVTLPRKLILEWVEAIQRNKFTRATPARDIRNAVRESTKFSTQLHSFETQLKAAAFAQIESLRVQENILYITADDLDRNFTDGINRNNLQQRIAKLLLLSKEDSFTPYFLIINGSEKFESSVFLREVIANVKKVSMDIGIKNLNNNKRSVIAELVPSNVFMIGIVGDDEFSENMFSGITVNRLNEQYTVNPHQDYHQNFDQKDLQELEGIGCEYGKLLLDCTFGFGMIPDCRYENYIQKIEDYIRFQGFSYQKYIMRNFFLSLKTKPFVILAGISGTGKSKLVKLFAKALDATSENGQFTLIPVRPDWSDPSELIGYTDLSGHFRKGKLTEVLIEASKPENQTKPYFVCLDEMNLARVEHYFSDLLSIIETQEWQSDEGTKRIVTQNIVSFTTESGEYTISLPENVYIIGTVNMDETTHPFSKKVLDRANTIEFNHIEISNWDFLTTSVNEKLSPLKVPNSFLRSEYLQLKDASGYEELIKAIIQKLEPIHKILETTNSHFGFRVRDGICFYMIYNQMYGLLTEDDAFDLQLCQKILPRLQGSSEALKKMLVALLGLTFRQQDKFKAEDLMNPRTSLYKIVFEEMEPVDASYKQSARKIAYMLRRLEEDGFTSFWLS